MSKKPNRYCPICNAHYYVCLSCGDRGTWKSMCDTPQHYQVYMTLIQYTRKEISKAEAKGYLENIGIKAEDVATFKPEVQNLIKEIQYEEPKAEKRRKVANVKEPKIEAVVNDVEIEINGELHD